MHRTPDLVEKAIAQAKATGISPQDIAQQFGVDTTTVHAIVRRHGDLVEATKDMKSDYFSAGFKFIWLSALDKLRTAGALSSQDHKNYALSAAISIDKVALIQGWPTQVIAHLHEHRHDIKGLADKLASVARRLDDGGTTVMGPGLLEREL